MKNVLAGLAVVAAVTGLGLLGGVVPPLVPVLAVALPYAAAAVCLGGLTAKVLRWAATPVPFRIPATCGQQRSLRWIEPARLDNPSTGLGATGRVLLEAFLFRSLFRGSRAELLPGGRFVYGGDRSLWLLGLGFHVSLLVVVLRHARLLLEPVPAFFGLLQAADGFFQVGVPTVYLSDLALVACLAGLLLRRLALPELRYLSLPIDHLALFLLLGIATTGLCLRHGERADVAAVKELAMGLVTFHPRVPEGLGSVVLAHVALASTLLLVLPFSKLVHAAGVFLSPTRNLPNDSRARRHVNPWNPAVKGRSYAEWEDEFRDRMKAAGLAVEKD